MPVIDTERYIIEGKSIGRGGFGEVYRARDLLYDRDVVIKTIAAPSMYGMDEVKIRKQFFREAVVSARLGFQTPYIVKVYDYGYDKAGGLPFFVLEYLPNGDLRNHIGNFTWTQAAKLLSDLLTGLSVAHKNGVVHSDISPDNILLEGNDTYKLNDFGLAKFLTSALLARTKTASLTGGKAAYLPVDHWHTGERNEYSDLYGLAMTILHLTTGHLPRINFTKHPLTPDWLAQTQTQDIKNVPLHLATNDPEFSVLAVDVPPDLQLAVKPKNTPITYNYHLIITKSIMLEVLDTIFIGRPTKTDDIVQMIKSLMMNHIRSVAKGLKEPQTKEPQNDGAPSETSNEKPRTQRKPSG